MRGLFAIATLLLLGAAATGCAAIEGLSAYSKGDCAGGDCDASVDAKVGPDAGHDAGHPLHHRDAGHDAGRDAGRDTGHVMTTPDSGVRCEIDGTAYTPGTTNPSNPCQTCQPGTSASAWTNLADGTQCGSGEACSGGQCAAQCEIAGKAYAASAVNPTNACETCDPATSSSAWTDLADGTSCGAEKECTAGKCGSGCFISGMPYAAKAADPTNSCEACIPATSTTAWSDVTDGTACGSGKVCHKGACASGCDIAGAYYAASAANPNDPCQSCEPATSTSAWGNVADGTSCGNGQVCSGGKCGTQCDIGGTIYASSAVDPMNACQSCQPGTSTSSWNNLADGTGCGSGEVCDAGVCGSGCFIGGAVYGSSATDPTNDCEGCVPATSTSAWSDLRDGTPCGTGGLCNSGTCVSGCEIGNVYYATLAANPNNACQNCQPAASTTAWSNLADGTGCGNGEICAMGTCGSECDIGGMVYASGAPNPANACQTCQPGTSTSAWIGLTDGTTCGAGEVCSAVSCLAGCYIGGAFYAPTAGNPANVCQSCQPATSTSAWSDVAEGTSCGTAQVCNGSTCGPGCFIGGAYYASAAANPGNACQACQPSESTTGWSNADGLSSACASDQVCTGGGCQAGCFIGGTVYGSAEADAADSVDPANPCQTCQPDTSNSAWTNAADGTACGNGQICSGGQCGTQCDIGGIIYTVGTVNPGNPCQSCQPALTTSDWSNLIDGSSCGAGEVCSQGTCGSGCFIGGTIYTPTTPNPANDCQSCQPVTSTTTWSNDSDGTGCGAGDVCTQGNCGSGCFIDGTVYTPTEANPGNPCQTCQPGTTTTDWSNLPDWTTCGAGNVCQGGTCFPVCTVTETSTVNETSPYGVAISVSYSMVGGGGGVGGGSGYWAAGGGGGSSAILTGASVIDVAAGGSGGIDGCCIAPGGNGNTVSNLFTLGAGANLTVYVGGGGGGGGWDDGGGGASGYFGGAGGEALGYYSQGGQGGSTAGGVGVNGATSGASVAGGTGSGGTSGGLGGAAATGGAGGPMWDSGGGGGGFGGGGGACTNDDVDLPSAGGTSGATAASVTTDQGGLGASTWASATTLPAVAGAGGASEPGQGGNAGLVILQYVSPTGVCSL